MSRKTKKPKQRPQGSKLGLGNDDSSASSHWKKAFTWTAITAVLATVGALGFREMEHRVLSGRITAVPCELRVALTDLPSWMPLTLGRQIGATLLPSGAKYYDKQLTATVMRRAQANPWVREVHRVEKRLDSDRSLAVVEVGAAFRVAVAKVHTGKGYAYIDAEGVRLPAAQVPQWALAEAAKVTFYLDRDDAPPGRKLSRVHYVMINGVQAPVPAVGDAWGGADLATGLRVLGLVHNKPYANQITAIDVRNFAGRISRAEPHLRMYAQVGRGGSTDIRFGRFPLPGGDYVISPERKLSYLDEYAEDHGGQLAGLNRYIDLRYDELHVSIN